MKLIRCYIENFGRLSDFSYDFTEGCNVICRENGWGKSTLAAFIRVILFGFQNESRRDGFENERKRYKPWQKGIYGGELEFETAGIVYSVRRSFGTKSSEDDFALIRQDTGMLCEDFSEKIGEELFQIDGEGFSRTVFLSQNDCQTETTGSINAKIGNLAENTDDINNFESADKRLGDLLNTLTPSRKTGKLSKMKSRLTELSAEIGRKGELEGSIQRLSEMRKGCAENREKLEQEQKELSEKLNAIGAYKDKKAKKERYEALLEESRKRQEEWEAAKAVFPKGLPDEEELRLTQEKYHNAEALQQSLKAYELTPEEESAREKYGNRFDREMEPAVFQEKEAQAEEYESLQLEIAGMKLSPEEERKLEKYSLLYGSPEEELEEQSRVRRTFGKWKENQAAQRTKEESLQMWEAMNGTTQKTGGMSKGRIFCFILGILSAALLAVAVICLTVPGMDWWSGNSRIAAAIVGLAGVLCSAVSFGMTGRREGKKASPEENHGNRLLAELKALQEEQEGLEGILREFCERHGSSFLAEEIEEKLQEVQDDVREYKRLLQKKDQSSTDRLPRAEELREELNRFLSGFSMAPGNREASSDREIFYSRAVAFAKEQWEKQQRIRKKAAEYDACRRRQRQLLEEIREYLEGLQITPQSPLGGQLEELLTKRREVETKAREWKRAEAEKNQFAEAEDVGALLSLEAPERDVSLKNLTERQEELTDELEAVFRNIQEYNRQVEGLQEKLEEIKELEGEKEGLEEKLTEWQHRYTLLKQTRELLGEAKSAFTAKYTEPVMSGFRKYYGLMAGQNGEAIHMDANTRLHIMEQNQPRELIYQSPGKQDLIGICMRMALVEAMYQKEKPFLVMDDPFVNLDEKRTEGGQRFLQEISKEYQVIYFTCHESRIGC